MTRRRRRSRLLLLLLAVALVDPAMGNYRVLTNMAAELLVHAAQHELSELDEKLFFDVFNPERTATARRTLVRRA